MSNDIDNWNDLELMDKRTKEYRNKLDEYIKKYIDSGLPNSLKTEIVMTLNFRAWLHFLKLRTEPTAHPDIRVIANLIKDDLRSRIQCIF